MFRKVTSGIRQRSKAEIELAKRLNEGLIEDQNNLVKGMNELNEDIISHNMLI